VVICTGSQGEPQAALPRIAIDDHRHVKLDADDVVVFSAREIPGNEKAIGRVMNHVARRGAEVVYEGIKHVHVSGHGSEEELKLMLSLVRPRYFVPIHGEYRQLAQHARVASKVSAGTRVLLAENGDLIRIDEHGARIAEKVPAGRILIDGTRSGEVGDEVLRDRRHLAGDGLVVPVISINRQSGAVEETDVITRGFVVDARTETLLKEIPALVGAAIEAAGVEERTDPGLIKEKIRVDLQRLFRKRSGLRPLVLPVVMEV
jgi:ribonuclease J